VYTTTRKAILSTRNPYFYSGSAGSGIGSPHGGPGYIWPLAIIAQAITSKNDEEIKTCLTTLISVATETGYMHESFNSNNQSDYTRHWFSWANGMFGELILQLVLERPYLVKKDRGSKKGPKV
jgi:hypothetical protein